METTQTGITTVDAYMATQPIALRAGLEEIRRTIREAAPEADERISYQMPGYWYMGKLIWFAAFKKHYGLYLPPAILNVFRDRLSAYEMTKSAVHLPFDAPIPVRLITEIVQYAVQKNQEQQAAKQQTRKR